MKTKYRVVKCWSCHRSEWVYEIESSGNGGITWGISRDKQQYDTPVHARQAILKLQQDDRYHGLRTVVWEE